MDYGVDEGAEKMGGVLGQKNVRNFSCKLTAMLSISRQSIILTYLLFFSFSLFFFIQEVSCIILKKYYL